MLYSIASVSDKCFPQQGGLFSHPLPTTPVIHLVMSAHVPYGVIHAFEGLAVEQRHPSTDTRNHESLWAQLTACTHLPKLPCWQLNWLGPLSPLRPPHPHAAPRLRPCWCSHPSIHGCFSRAHLCLPLSPGSKSPLTPPLGP